MEELFLSADELGYLLEVADYIERRFDVTIETPGREGYQPGEVVMAIVHGQKTNLVSSLKYIKSRFFPEESNFFWYIKELEIIYGNPFWIQTLEKIHGVCIQYVLYGKLKVSGTKTGVTSAISAMGGLIKNFKHNTENNSKYLTNEIANILPKNANVGNIVKQIDHLPSNIKKTLLSWTIEAYLDENSSQCVICVGSPVKEEPPLITLIDSDDEGKVQIISKHHIKRKKLPSILNQRRNFITSQGTHETAFICEKPTKHESNTLIESTAVENNLCWYYIPPRKTLQPPPEECYFAGGHGKERFTFSSIGAISM